MSAARGRAALLALIATGLFSSPTLADRIHLRSGGSVDVARWWVEGDWIYYESDNGTLGLPRRSVLRVESTQPSDSSPRSEADAESDRTPEAEPAERPESKSERRGSDSGLPRADLDGHRLPDPQRDAELRELIQDGERAFGEKRFEQAIAAFDRALDEDERLLRARVGYTVASMAIQDDTTALALVLDGLRLHPDVSVLHELLGNLRNREERVPDALASWKRAAALQPSERLDEKIAKAERELAAGSKYDFARTSHFNVRYDGDVDDTLAREVQDHLEEEFWRITKALDFAPQQPITLLLYPKREFKDVTQAAEWVGGLFDGKIRVPLGGLSRLDARAKRLLTHELTHAVAHAKSRGTCPWWLHEGLAQWFEGKRLDPAKSAKLLEKEASGSIEGRSTDDVHFEYASALGLVTYLVELRGEFGLAWLLDELRSGVDEEAAALARVRPAVGRAQA